MIKVLIVDDSRTSRLALRKVLEKDADIFVVGEAEDGPQALWMIEKYDPHFVTMDVYLERENGLDIIKTIMSTAPRPILVVTSVNPHDPGLIYKVLESGALEVAAKPCAQSHPDYERQAAHFIRLVKTLAKVPILHQKRAKTNAPPLHDIDLCNNTTSSDIGRNKSFGILLIGASTGGPPVVCKIITKLPKPLTIPVIVVQHISKGFAGGFADWLTQSTGHRAVLVDKTMSIQPGLVYVAADDSDMIFSSSTTLRPRSDMNPMGPNPNIDRLFLSAAEHCRSSIVATILTGMGSDGATGLTALRNIGAVTLAQSPETCAVDSMPQSAIRSGAAQRTLTPEEMSEYFASRIRAGSRRV